MYSLQYYTLMHPTGLEIFDLNLQTESDAGAQLDSLTQCLNVCANQ